MNSFSGRLVVARVSADGRHSELMVSLKSQVKKRLGEGKGDAHDIQCLCAVRPWALSLASVAGAETRSALRRAPYRVLLPILEGARRGYETSSATNYQDILAPGMPSQPLSIAGASRSSTSPACVR